jgi:transcriptional regulator with XRE-family HTH domain
VTKTPDWRALPRGIRCPEAVKDWADLIQFIRAKNNWSQRRLGEELGVAELAVRTWERDGRHPRNKLIHRVISDLAKDVFTPEEVNALSCGAYLDPAKKIPKKFLNKCKKKIKQK